MEKLINLNQAKIGQMYIVEKIERSISPELKKRLLELGFIKNARVTLVHRSKISKGGIVVLLSSKICLDENILSNIWVREI